MSSRCLSRFVVVEFLESSALSKRQERHQNLWVSDPSRDGNAGKNVSARCVTTVLVCCLYGACTVVVRCLYGACTMVVQWLYNGCSMVVQWLYNGCTMVVRWLYLWCNLQYRFNCPKAGQGHFWDVVVRRLFIFHVLIECLTDSTKYDPFSLFAMSMLFNVFQCLFNVFRLFLLFSFSRTDVTVRVGDTLASGKSEQTNRLLY